MKFGFYEPRVAVVIRWFQSQVGLPQADGSIKPFDMEDFKERLVNPLHRFMQSMGREVKRIIIVSNSDQRFGLGEATDNEGHTSTFRALCHAFPREMAHDFIRVVIDPLWGNNAGTAHALNTGWATVQEDPEITHLLSWNPELQMTGGILARMFSHLERHGLDLTGAYRQGYWRLYQWQLPQNTACLYSMELLESLKGFSVECDGNDRSVIQIPSLGKVSRAGMEDYDLSLRYALQYGRFPRWGMVGRADPFFWDINFVPGSERAEMLRAKIARQPAVLEYRAQERFPNTPYPELMDTFFAHRHED